LSHIQRLFDPNEILTEQLYCEREYSPLEYIMDDYNEAVQQGSR